MSSGSNNYRWAALPRLDTSIDITELEVNFLIERPGSGVSPIPYSRLIVGVAEDVTWFSGYLPAASMELSAPSHAYTYSGFVPVDTVDLSDEPVASLHSVTVRFVNYTGSGRYIVFYTPSPGSDTLPSNGFDLDNIELRLSRPCPTPEHVRVTHVTDDSVFATWDCGLHPCGAYGNANPDQWLVFVGAPGFDIGSVEPQIFYDNSASIGGLDPNRDYELVVIAICGGSEGYPSYPAPFHTLCGPLVTLPFVEDFESVRGIPSYDTHSPENTLPDCWLYYNTCYGGGPWVHNDSTYVHGGTNALRFHAPCPSSDQLAIMPLTDSTLYPVSSLQVSFWMRTAHFYYNSFIVVGVMSDPTDTATFVAVDTARIVSLNGYSRHTVRLDRYFGPHGHVAFMAPHDIPQSNRPYIDDIVLDELPCAPADNLHAVYASLDSLTIAWSDTSRSSTLWHVEYDTIDFIPGTSDRSGAGGLVMVGCGEGQIDSSSLVRHHSSLTLTGLASGTVYHIYVYPSCFDSVVARHLAASTLHSSPHTLPFSGGFDDDDNSDGWTLTGNNQHNRWVIGEATGHPGRSLYISDNGIHNNYSGQASTVFATRALRFDSVGDYLYSFDWRCNGEMHYDYLRAAIVPAYMVLTAGDLCGFDGIEVPEGGIALDNQSYLNQSTTWQNLAGSFHITTPGNYLLVFLWHNNLGGYYQTPAAVDNINIMLGGGALPPPSHIVTVSVNNAEYGTVTGGGLYNHGDTATLVAMPRTGHLFSQWDDGDTTNPRNVVVTSDTSLTAIFLPVEGIGVVSVDNWRIYPNPTSGELTVDAGTQLAATHLTDMLGRRQELTPTAVGAGVYSLDISTYPPATYLLTLIASDGSEHTLRLLKK